jgi:hypothetical protein
MNKEQYIAQVTLLLDCLAVLKDQALFALKGGTAINFFIRDLPRLSVDIDLTFLKSVPRDEAILATGSYDFIFPTIPTHSICTLPLVISSW